MSRPAPGRGGVAPWGGVCLCLVAGCGRFRLNPYNGEDLPSRFTAPRPRVGGRHAAGRIFGFRLCVTARPRVGGTLAVTLVSLFTQENPFSDTSDEIIECIR